MGILQDTIDEFKQGVESTIDIVDDALNVDEFFQEAYKDFEDFTDEAGSDISNLWNEMFDETEEMLENVGPVAVEAWDDVETSLEEAWGGVSDIADGVVDAVDFVPAVFSGLLGGGGGGSQGAASGGTELGFLQSDVLKMSVGSNLIGDLSFITDIPEKTEAEKTLLTTLSDSEVAALYSRVMSRANLAKLGQRMARPGSLNPFKDASNASRGITTTSNVVATKSSNIQTPTASEVDSGTTNVPSAEAIAGTGTAADANVKTEGVAPTPITGAETPAPEPINPATPEATEDQLKAKEALTQLRELKADTEFQKKGIAEFRDGNGLTLTERRAKGDAAVDLDFKNGKITFDQVKALKAKNRAETVTNYSVDEFLKGRYTNAFGVETSFLEQVSNERGIDFAKNMSANIKKELESRNFKLNTLQDRYKARRDKIFSDLGIDPTKLGSENKSLMEA